MVDPIHRLARKQSARPRGEGCCEVGISTDSAFGYKLIPFLTSNHGSFYYNQIAALKFLVGNSTGALASLEEFFNGIYKNQIKADGEQPLEAKRTRPYHYRAYNLAALIVSLYSIICDVSAFTQISIILPL
jgi:hypothetical protein